MSRPGQNLPLPQPIATPAFDSRLIAVEKGLLSGDVLVALAARRRQLQRLRQVAAIRPRDTWLPGQNFFGPQPVAMPAVTTLLMAVAWGVCFGDVLEVDAARRREVERLHEEARPSRPG